MLFCSKNILSDSTLFFYLGYLSQSTTFDYNSKHPELSFKNRVDSWGLGNPKKPKETTFDDMRLSPLQPTA